MGKSQNQLYKVWITAEKFSPKKPSHIPWTQSFHDSLTTIELTHWFVRDSELRISTMPHEFPTLRCQWKILKSQFDQKKRRNNFFPRTFVNLNLIQKNYLSPFCSTKSWWKIGKSYSHGLVLALTSCRSNSACLAAHSWTFGAKKTLFLSAAHRSKV